MLAFKSNDGFIRKEKKDAMTKPNEKTKTTFFINYKSFVDPLSK